ncbi:hypothetical protein ACFWYW_19780 [Nonomuraea sp. NPDC059023]|uniref:hypothetical protein n=1 Tax=unclassified Nonomuraea TaxID=2593643 RepID=UPI0036941146
MNEIATRLSPVDARSLTDEIRNTTERLYALLLRAYEGQAWTALGYGSWRDYAMTEFEMSQSRAYQLLDQARVVKAIEDEASVVEAEVDFDVEVEVQPRSTIVESAPPVLPTESQARELRPLLDEPAKLRQTWREAKRATQGKPTASAVREARERVEGAAREAAEQIAEVKAEFDEAAERERELAAMPGMQSLNERLHREQPYGLAAVSIRYAIEQIPFDMDPVELAHNIPSYSEHDVERLPAALAWLASFQSAFQARRASVA